MPQSRLLIAVSSPWASQKMVEPVCDMARRLDADVVVAHVTEMLEDDESESQARARGEQTLSVLTEALTEAGVKADGVILYSDDVAKAILNTARARGCTMIAVGLTGKGILKRLIAGDIPQNVLRQADLPVLVVPANWSGTI